MDRAKHPTGEHIILSILKVLYTKLRAVTKRRDVSVNIQV